MHPLVSNETNQELKRCINLFLSVVTGIRVFSIFPGIYLRLVRCRFPSPHAQLDTGAETPGPGNQDSSVHGCHSPDTRVCYLLNEP